MKKARIMLSAIAVVGIVAGAMAFQAKHFQAQVFYTTTSDAVCSNLLQDYTTQVILTAPSTITTYFVTDDPLQTTTTCPNVAIYELP